jgi:hypothetical protein
MKARRLSLTLVVSLIGLVGGCGKGLSSADEAFVTMLLPPEFLAFHMSGNRVSNSDLRQTCSATIHEAGQAKGKFARESVQLEEGVGSGYAFDLDADLGSGGWSISTNGQAPTPGNYTIFRSLVIDCVSALRGEYQADAESTPIQPISMRQ